MKRIIKKSNRKGFTLVETLLATFILVVVSTMLVNGFISTMGFSYQTSVYSKSGSNNYAACMNKVAQWNTLTDCGDGGREEKGKDYYTANGWVQGKAGKPGKDWKACIRTWERNSFNRPVNRSGGNEFTKLSMN